MSEKPPALTEKPPTLTEKAEASLSDIRDQVEGLGAQIGDVLYKLERRCTSCDDDVKGDVFCEACGTPPKCWGCNYSITDGVCGQCHGNKVDDAKESTLGSYHPNGVNRAHALPDQLLAFLAMIVDACPCRGMHKQCARCQDADYLRRAYQASLGAIRT
jgi:hypothetical protein